MKYYLHIGVHKTGTSTLQKNILNRLPSPEYIYLGVKFPRAAQQNALYTRLMHAVCRAAGGEFDNEFDSIRLEIENLCRTAEKGVVLSDELFSTGGKAHFGGLVPPQERLRRLSLILRDRPVSVLVTVRKQTDALFSLYVQKHRYLAKKSRDFDKFIAESDLCAYDYHGYANKISENFQNSRVCFANFHEIASGSFLKSIMRWLEYDRENLGFDLRHEKKRYKDTSWVKADPVTLGYALKKLLSPTLRDSIAKSKLGQRMLKPMYRAMEGKALTKPEAISRLDTARAIHIERMFSDSNRRLQEKFGIDLNFFSAGEESDCA